MCAEYNELKTELSDFLRGFAQDGKVNVVAQANSCRKLLRVEQVKKYIFMVRTNNYYYCIFAHYLFPPIGGVQERH